MRRTTDVAAFNEQRIVLLLRILGVFLITAYLVLWLSLRHYPFLDFPNNLARAFIISQLLTDPGSPFHQHFVFFPSFRPHILGDILMSQLLRIVSLEAAAQLWIVLAFAALPLAIVTYLRVLGKHQLDVLLVLFLSLYLASDWFFLTGFFNYKLAVSFYFFALSAWIWLLRAIRAGSAGASEILPRFLIFSLAMTCCFLMHLAGFFFLAITIGTIVGLRIIARRISAREMVLTLAPALLLGLIYLFSKSSHHQTFNWSLDSLILRSPLNKLEAVGTMFVRFNTGIDVVLFALFLAIVAFSIYSRQGAADDDAVSGRRERIEHLLVAGALVLTYLALPVAVFNIYDIDDRALPFIFFYLVLAGVSGVSRGLITRERIALLAAAAFLALVNLAYMANYLPKHDHRLGEYKQALFAIPPGKRVLPISTVEDEGRIETLGHAGALYTILQRGFTPYIFSATTHSPANYFDYRQVTYAPTGYWYMRHKDRLVDWQRIAGSYDYIVITHPFQEERLTTPISGLRKIFENDAATVYALTSHRDPVLLLADRASGATARGIELSVPSMAK